MAKLFDIPSRTRSSRESDSALLVKTKKLSAPAPKTLKGKDSLMDRIKTIRALVESKLGYCREQVEPVRDIFRLVAYIDKVIENGICSIDTETTGLDPLKDIIVGPGIYTPGQKSIYIPVEHISYVTGVRVDNQIPRKAVIEQFKRLQDSNVKIIYHNAKYDYRMFKNDWGVDLNIYWDTMIGAFMLNENDRIGLKYVWELYCGQGQTDLAMNFDDMFKDLDFRYVPIDTATLYAGMDPKKTFELYEFEKNFLCEDMSGCKEKGLQGVARLFRNIEMPVIRTVSRMEDRGIALDLEYARTLEKEYNEQLKVCEDDFYKTLEMYRDEINTYKRRNPGSKFKEPVQISSPQQIGILLYDVLKLGDLSWGTGEGVLQSLDHPIARKVLAYRGVAKLLSTYITKMPRVCHSTDGKIHCSFNQCGAQTGRFSSSDPNLQNIPSKDKQIRKMFIPDEGKVLLGCDFSQQEPRILAHMSQDDRLIDSYAHNRDIYATVGSIVYKVPYEACLEFHADGTKNPEGKQRRSNMKTVVLGIMYERGPKSVAEQLGCSVQEASKIIKQFFDAFPKVKKWVDETHRLVQRYGFVEDAFGRKRRLLDAQLDDYTLELTGKVPTKNFDPLAMLTGKVQVKTSIDPRVEQSLLQELRGAYGQRAVAEIKKKAQGMGIKVHDNTGRVADALRQAVNFRIQGSAASQTKLAMSMVDNDKELQEYGFELLLQVHDELIGQCPKETAKKAGERLSHIMRHCADGILSVPFKCDVEITDRWYGDEVEL